MPTLIKKLPYQFWNYRDTRKLPKTKKIAVPELKPLGLFDKAEEPATVTGFISHHILLPTKSIPKRLLDFFQEELTFKNPEFLAAQKYGKGFVSYAIPEHIRMYLMDTEYIGLPRSVNVNHLKTSCDSCNLQLNLIDTRPQFETINFPEKEEIKPLFFQDEAIKQIVDSNIVLKFRCGRGKTIMALFAIAKIRLRTMIIVNTNILMGQWLEALKKVFAIEDSQIGIISGKKKTEGLITIAMEQTLVNMTRAEKRRLGNVYGHIIFDEAHSVGSAMYRELLSYFKARKITGLTATPERTDGLTPALKTYIGPIVEVDDLGEMPVKVNLIKTTFAYDFIGRKDKYHELLDVLIHDEERNKLILEVLKKYILQGKPIACYSNRIEHMEILSKMLKEQMPEIKTDILASEKDDKTVPAEMQEAIRQKIINGETQVLFGGKIIEQGFDCPPLSVGILATPTKSLRLLEQFLGRLQREYLGKKEAVLVDFVDEPTKTLMYQFFYKHKKLYTKQGYTKFWGSE